MEALARHLMYVALLVIIYSRTANATHRALLEPPQAAFPSAPYAWYNTFPLFKDKTRVWDRRVLDKGVHNLGRLTHFKRFFDKLRAGQPITVVAFGSSMVHDYAGCWQTSLQALWDLGMIPNPMLYPQQGSHVSLDRWQYVGDKCAKGGYMDGVMETINTTWPNYGHIFVNNGKGGTCLHSIVSASCMSSFTPPHLDLVLLDTVTNTCPNYDVGVEKMVRQFLHHRSRPLVVLVSNARNCNNANRTLSNQCATECLREAHGNVSQPACQGLPDPFNGVDRVWSQEKIAARIDPIALRYDVGHLNLFSIMNQLVNGGVAERLGMPRITFVSQFYIDWVHFNKAALGTLLLSDLLLHWLVRGQEALAALPPERQAEALNDTPAAEPLHPEALQQYATRCYGVSVRHARDMLVAGKAGGADAASMVAEIERWQPGDTFEFVQAYVPHKPIQALPPLNVTRSDGWELQMYYTGANRARKLKPGWITSTAGALLEFVVDSSFEGHAEAEVEALVSYTVSYDGWGVGKLCCTEGCACSCQELRANWESGVYVSLIQVHPFGVTQSAACTMQLRVLNDTASGGHKFKLSSVMLRAKQAEQGTAAAGRRLASTKPCARCVP